MRKIIIAAMGRGREIGKGGSLPWHISEDLRKFKAITTGYPVIMGRRTYESIPKTPLPGRDNIVLSKSVSFPGTTTATSLEDAYSIAEARNSRRCFVIGGGTVYRQALETADVILLTLIDADIPEADTFFPEIDKRVWKEMSRTEYLTDEKTGLKYCFVAYRNCKKERLYLESENTEYDYGHDVNHNSNDF